MSTKPQTEIELLAEIFSDIMGISPEEVLETSTLEDLGADSLDMVEITNTIDEEFDIDLPIEPLSAELTVSDLLELIEEERSKS